VVALVLSLVPPPTRHRFWLFELKLIGVSAAGAGGTRLFS